MQSRKGHAPTVKIQPVIRGDISILPPLESETKSNPSLGYAFRARALSSPIQAPTLKLWQQEIDRARARAFVFRFLAKAFSYPKPDDWHWLSNPTIQTVFCSAVRHLVPQENAPLRKLAADIVHQLHPGQYEAFLDEQVAFFNHAEWNDFASGESQTAKVRPSGSRSSEWSALEVLLKSFGLQMYEWPGQPNDLLCAGLEFMSWLQTREAELLEQEEEEQATLHHHAQEQLLAGFLAKWVKQPAPASGALLAQLVLFSKEFVELQRRPRELAPQRQRQTVAPRAVQL